MSYTSGLLLGASFGKRIHDFFVNKKIHRNPPAAAVLELVHELPGRRRYRASSLVGNESLAVLLEEKLSKLMFMADIEVNAATGSIVFWYSEENTEKIDALVEFLTNRIFIIRGNKAECMGETSSTIRSFREVFSRLNQKIRAKTANILDLSSLAAFVFFIRGLRKIFLYRQVPSGPQMLWWAFSLLRGWAMV